MSAFAVVLDLRGDPLAPGVLDRVLEPMRDRGPDATGRWVDGSVALGHHLLALMPEDVGSTQPVVLGRLRGVFDGRLDNRDELARVLAEPRAGASPPTDGELAVRAYARWGDESASHLLGDFAFAVWDADRHLLYAARDQIGVRPLFYAERNGVLVVATDIRGVLAHPTLAKEPDVRHVAATVARTFGNETHTLYEHVRRVPAAHVLTAQRHVATRRYWDIPIDREQGGDEVDELDRFLEVFGEAVRCRLRASSVTVALSGGLDSTLVAAVAEQEVGARRAQTGSLTTTSIVFPGRDCDESEWIDLARADSPSGDRRIPWSPVAWATIVEEARATQQLPAQPNAALDAMVRDGMRRTAVLTGSGGDQWMEGSVGYFHDLRVGRRYRELLTYLLRGDSWWLVRDTLVGRVAARWQHTSAGPVSNPALDVLGAELRTQVPDEREHAARSLSAAAPAETSARYEALHSSWLPFVFDATDRAAGAGHLEAWHPFFDRRVVAFAFALSDAERWRGSDSRWFQRRALGRLGRESVARRRSKAEFTEPFVEQLLALPLEELIGHARVVDLGWIAPEAITEAVSATRRGTTSAVVSTLWTVMALEAWLWAVW